MTFHPAFLLTIVEWFLLKIDRRTIFVISSIVRLFDGNKYRTMARAVNVPVSCFNDIRTFTGMFSSSLNFCRTEPDNGLFSNRWATCWNHFCTSGGGIAKIKISQMFRRKQTEQQRNLPMVFLFRTSFSFCNRCNTAWSRSRRFTKRLYLMINGSFSSFISKSSGSLSTIEFLFWSFCLLCDWLLIFSLITMANSSSINEVEKKWS